MVTKNLHHPTAPEIRAAAELLLKKIRALQVAEEAAIEQARELFRLVDGAVLPRLNHAVYEESKGILGDLDGTSGSMFESEKTIADVKTLLELVDLAAKREIDGDG